MELIPYTARDGREIVLYVIPFSHLRRPAMMTGHLSLSWREKEDRV